MGIHFILKKVLVSSLTLAYIAMMISSLVINYHNDKLGVALITHPIMLLYLYILIRTYNNVAKKIGDKDRSLYFILVAFVGTIFPFWNLYIFYQHKIFNPIIGISLFLAILWTANIFLWFSEPEFKDQ